MKTPDNLKYAESHEWARAEGEVVTVGITDHAQHELTDIVFVELPHVGDEVTQGKTCAVVESVKAASDIYAPVSGKVIEINTVLEGNSALVNDDPYGQGWFFKVRMSDPADLAKLKSPADYKAQIGA
ncbi:MAG: glycine cleavage system protein GcvH [Verrucomicrobiae bacterium]|nr:glycine cleavage system protein GcvH [Verrucomicrobiae bacterium]